MVFSDKGVVKARKSITAKRKAKKKVAKKKTKKAKKKK